MARSTYAILADVVALVHGAYAAAIVVGLVLIWIGWFRKWEWVRHPWLRIIHLGMILYVVGQAWLGRICPLTVLEARLRGRAGQEFTGSPIAEIVHAMLFFETAPVVFVISYTVCGLLIVLALFVVPPRWSRLP